MRKATLEDVARLAKTSKCTASRALSSKGYVAERTRQEILSAAKELNFEPNVHAKRLLNGASDVVSMICFGIDLDVGVRKNLLVEQSIAELGFKVPVYSGRYGSDRQVAALISQIRRERPRALVCANLEFPLGALSELKAFCSDGGLLVCYDAPVDLDCSKVIFDREHNTYAAAQRLIDLGHRKIGFYYNAILLPDDRYAGFCRALDDSGLELRSDWLFQGRYEEGGARAALQFLALKERPTAMCLMNDCAASAFVAEVQRHGVLVPQDLSIVSHDNLPIAQYAATPLTTMSNPIDAVAKAVVDLLKEAIDARGTRPGKTIVCRGELIDRGSAIPYAERRNT
jgi:DNA-binding LacI/PurR family transcriptional regulator